MLYTLPLSDKFSKIDIASTFFLSSYNYGPKQYFENILINLRNNKQMLFKNEILTQWRN